jgi:thiol-disulfide isomerase/thioredoxin
MTGRVVSVGIGVTLALVAAAIVAGPKLLRHDPDAVGAAAPATAMAALAQPGEQPNAPAVGTPPEVPRKAPELAVQLVSGQQLTGQQVLLSQFRGKVVLIEFVHTTCPHCQHDSEIVEQLYKELGPRGFQPVGVAFNDNATLLVEDFVKMLGLTYPVGVASRDTVLGYLQHSYLEPLYVPQMIFVDRKGIIRAQHGGIGDDFLKDDPEKHQLEQNLRIQIEELLKASAPHKKGQTSSLRVRLPHQA